jgi:hypothetical protein
MRQSPKPRSRYQRQSKFARQHYYAWRLNYHDWLAVWRDHLDHYDDFELVLIDEANPIFQKGNVGLRVVTTRATQTRKQQLREALAKL